MMWLSGFEILWLSGLDMMWLSGFEMLWFSGLNMYWLSGFEMRWLNGLETRWPNGGGDLLVLMILLYRTPQTIKIRYLSQQPSFLVHYTPLLKKSSLGYVPLLTNQSLPFVALSRVASEETLYHNHNRPSDSAGQRGSLCTFMMQKSNISSSSG